MKDKEVGKGQILQMFLIVSVPKFSFLFLLPKPYDRSSTQTRNSINLSTYNLTSYRTLSPLFYPLLSSYTYSVHHSLNKLIAQMPPLPETSRPSHCIGWFPNGPVMDTWPREAHLPMKMLAYKALRTMWFSWANVTIPDLDQRTP